MFITTALLCSPAVGALKQTLRGNSIFTGVYSLLIGMLFAEDVGEYTVTATNQFGFISGSVFLVPEGRH